MAVATTGTLSPRSGKEGQTVELTIQALEDLLRRKWAAPRPKVLWASMETMNGIERHLLLIMQEPRMILSRPSPTTRTGNATLLLGVPRSRRAVSLRLETMELMTGGR